MEDFAVFENYETGWAESKSALNQEIALAKRLSIPTQLDRERPQIVGFARDLRQQSSSFRYSAFAHDFIEQRFVN
jgi:hypothetical protein